MAPSRPTDLPSNLEFIFTLLNLPFLAFPAATPEGGVPILGNASKSLKTGNPVRLGPTPCSCNRFLYLLTRWGVATFERRAAENIAPSQNSTKWWGVWRNSSSHLHKILAFLYKVIIEKTLKTFTKTVRGSHSRSHHYHHLDLRLAFMLGKPEPNISSQMVVSLTVIFIPWDPIRNIPLMVQIPG